MLCPEANATGGQDVTFQLDITGLEPGFAFDRVQLEAHALNSSGAYQSEGQVREWNLTAAQGAGAASLADFAALTDYDLNNAHPALPVLEAETPATAGASLSLRLTASKGTDNGGCFFGLSRIVLYDSAEGGPEAAGPQDEAGTTAFMVDLSHGSFTALNGNGTYARAWSSTAQEPGLTLSTDRNDMAAAGSAIDCYATSGGSTYTLTASVGYGVLSYCIDFTNAGAQNMSVTPSNGSAVTGSGFGAARVDVQGLDERTASFIVTSANGSTAAARTARFFVKVAPGGAPAEAYTELFVSRSGGIPYRIPAIARTHDGSLLALSDYRPCKADIGNGHVDIVGRISTDNGQTGAKPSPWPTAQASAAGPTRATATPRSWPTMRATACCSSAPPATWSTAPPPGRIPSALHAFTARITAAPGPHRPTSPKPFTRSSTAAASATSTASSSAPAASARAAT